MKRKLTDFGRLLIVLGAIGLFATAILSFTVYAGLDQGSLPAASFLIIMLGIAFAFPSLLQDMNGGLSTMRITVFAVVLLFCTIYFKMGWSISKYEELTIDQRWVYILGLAFGSKAFQRFGEQDDDDKVKSTKKETTIEEKQEISVSSKGKDTSHDVV